MVYTALLNERGGFESDLTITRLGVDSFLLVTGSAQPTRDADWIARHIGADEAATLADVSALTAVLSVMGPNAKELLCRVGAPDTGERAGAGAAPVLVAPPRSTSASPGSARRA